MAANTLPDVLQQLFDTDARDLAVTSGCVQRVRAFNGASLAQTLVFGALECPEMKSRALAQTAAQLGILVSPQAIDQRLNKKKTAEFFRQLVEAAVQKEVLGGQIEEALLKRFTRVELLDSTSITLPPELAEVWSGCGGDGSKASLKIQVRYDVVHGGLCIDLTDGKNCDQTAALKTKDIAKGSLQVRDLGYFDLDALEYVQNCDAFFVTRLMSSTVVSDLNGQRLDLKALLRAAAAGVVDREVLVGKTKQFRVRFIAQKLPAEVAAKRRRTLNTKAKKNRYAPTDLALALRDWTIVITNLPSESTTFDEVLALLRIRWQIELLFKLWKSEGKLATSNSRQPQRILCETYVKLLMVLVMHWVLVQSHWKQVNRSLVKGARCIQAEAWNLLRALVESVVALAVVLERLQKVLVKTATIQRRKKKPATYQVLEDPTRYGYKACA